MRGTPFIKGDWTGGLNTVDSPYTVDEPEARDCMNVVSTTRGAIKKRNGSQVFASTVAASFPNLEVTDTFERANEAELSNGGKWTVLQSSHTDGTLANRGELLSNAWKSRLGTNDGAYWNKEEQTDPAVSIEISERPAAGNATGIWACLSSSTLSGYEFRCRIPNATEAELELWRYVEGAWKNLGFKTITGVVATDQLGISVKAGVVAGWLKHEGTWTKQLEAADATFTKGYGGMFIGRSGKFKKFAIGEMPGAPTEEELTSLATVNIGGTKYMIASSATKLFSINAAGEMSKIGEGFTSGKWEVVQAPKATAKTTQGPVYLVNGVDKPQYWTGAAKNTAVAEWTGVGSATELTDGVLSEATSTVKSETAGFVPSDVGLILKFAAGHKYKLAAEEITLVEPQIEQVLNSKEVVVAMPAESAGWAATTSTVHFTIQRSFYEKGKHVPNGQYMVFHGNRIWMTGIKEDPSAVWFSELASIGEGGAQADPSQWPSANVVRFEASDGKEITGIGSVGPYLVVFKDNRSWIIHDVNTGANRQLSDTIGCVANRSIVETNTGTFFLTADQGVYLTDGTHLHEMSYNVKPTILAINPAQRANAAGAYFNNHYYLSFAYGTSSSANRTLDYDVQLKSWWLHDLTGNQWTIFEASAGEAFLYTCPPKAKAGVVRAFVPNLYTDSGANYTGNGILGAWWIGNWEPFAYYVFRHRIKAPMLKKRVRQVFFNGSGEIIPLVYRDFTEGGIQEPATVGSANQARPTFPVNFNQGQTVFGNENVSQLFGGELYEGVQMIYGGAQQTGAARLYALGVGFVWSMGFGNNSAEPFEVDAAGWMISFRKS